MQQDSCLNNQIKDILTSNETYKMKFQNFEENFSLKFNYRNSIEYVHFV